MESKEIAIRASIRSAILLEYPHLESTDETCICAENDIYDYLKCKRTGAPGATRTGPVFRDVKLTPDQESEMNCMDHIQNAISWVHGSNGTVKMAEEILDVVYGRRVAALTDERQETPAEQFAMKGVPLAKSAEALMEELEKQPRQDLLSILQIAASVPHTCVGELLSNADKVERWVKG